MSTRYNNGSHYENHPRASELEDGAAHAHRTAEHNGKQEHLTPHEQTRNALEHSDEGHPHPHAATVGHGVTAFGHEEIASLAHQLWVKRGSPEGSPEDDWFHAVRELRSRATAHSHSAPFIG